MSFNSNQQRGSSLIEILVTVLIFSIGMLGMAALQLNALRSTSDSNQRAQAVWLAQDLAERIRANPSGSVAEYAGAGNAPDCTALPTTQCSDRYNPATSTVVQATTCTAGQMAQFDRWEAECSYSALAAYSATNGRASSRDFISVRDGANSLFTLNANGTTVEISANVGSKLMQKTGNSTVATQNSIPMMQVQR